jgi:hypothetical protein
LDCFIVSEIKFANSELCVSKVSRFWSLSASIWRG